MRNYHELFADTVKEAETIAKTLKPNHLGYLFVNYHGTPIAALIDEGQQKGAFYTRYDVRKGRAPDLRYHKSADAYDALSRDVSSSDA